MRIFRHNKKESVRQYIEMLEAENKKLKEENDFLNDKVAIQEHAFNTAQACIKSYKEQWYELRSFRQAYQELADELAALKHKYQSQMDSLLQKE